MVPCHVIVSNTRSFSCYALICWYFSNTKTFIILYVPCSNNKWFHVTWFSVMTLAPSFEHLLMVPVLFSQSDYWSPRWCFHLPRWSLTASFFLDLPQALLYQPHKGPGQTQLCCVLLFLRVLLHLFWGRETQFLDKMAISLFHLTCSRQIFLQ